MKDNSEVAGTAALLMAFLAFLTRGQKGKYFWGGLAIIILLYALGPTTPVFGIILRIIPFLDSMAGPSVSMFIFTFCIAFLGGIGLQNLYDSNFKENGFFKNKSAYLLLVIPVLLLITALLFSFRSQGTISFYCKLFHPAIIPSGETIPVGWTHLENNLKYIQTGLWLAFIYTTITFIIIQLYDTRHRMKFLLYLLPFIVIISDCNFNERFIHVMNPENGFYDHPETNIIKMQNVWGRTIVYGMWESSFQLAHKNIPSTIGAHNKEPVWFFDLIGGVHRNNILKPQVTNLTGTRYIICPRNRIIPPNALGPYLLDTLITTRGHSVLENKNSYPHVFFVNKYEVISDRHEICSLVVNGKENLLNMVYLEEKPSLPISNDYDSTARANISWYSPDSVNIKVSCKRDMLLILTDNWYYDWKAYIDGKPCKIYRANSSFRAVEAPAKSKEVTFVYESFLYKTGKTMTFLGLLISFVVIGYYRLRPLKIKDYIKSLRKHF